MGEMEIKNEYGYFKLLVDGKFMGNYDTVTEAVTAYEEECEKEEDD